VLAAGTRTAWADSLDVADTLQNPAELPLWLDSSLVIIDSTAQTPVGLAQQWLLPLGVILATAAAAWLLFSVRSR